MSHIVLPFAAVVGGLCGDAVTVEQKITKTQTKIVKPIVGIRAPEVTRLFILSQKNVKTIQCTIFQLKTVSMLFLPMLFQIHKHSCS